MFCCIELVETSTGAPYVSQFRGDRLLKYGCLFLKKVQRGGVIFDPKNYNVDFLVSKRYILAVNFGKNVQKGGGGRGGHRQSKENPF